MFSNKSTFLLAMGSAAVSWWVGLCMDYDEVTNTIFTMAAAISDIAAASAAAISDIAAASTTASIAVITGLWEYTLLHPAKVALAIATAWAFHRTLFGFFIGAWNGLQQDIANKVAAATKIVLFVRDCYNWVHSSVASFSPFLRWFFPLLVISCIKAFFIMLAALAVLVVAGHKLEEVAFYSPMGMVSHFLFAAFALLVCDCLIGAQQPHHEEEQDGENEEEDGEDEEEDGEDEEEEEEDDTPGPPPIQTDFSELTRETYLGAEYSESQEVALCESYIDLLNDDFDDELKVYDIAPFTDAARVLQEILPEELSGHIKTFKNLDLSQFTTKDQLWRKISRAIHPDKFSSAPEEIRAMFEGLYKAVLNCRDNHCPFRPAPANYLTQQRQMVANELAQYLPVPPQQPTNN